MNADTTSVTEEGSQITQVTIDNAENVITTNIRSRVHGDSTNNKRRASQL